jgi:DNA modification methylase
MLEVLTAGAAHDDDLAMILRADARHIPLRDGCVQTVVTSPPYWGLRDYGTARWEGGDADCDHLEPPRGGRDPITAAKQLTSAGTLTYQFANECRKCGSRWRDAQIGLEPTPEAYVATMVSVFREVRRVLRDDGTVWLNLGDSYAGSGRGPSGNFQPDASCLDNRIPVPGLKPKDLCGIPWRVAFALQADGWYLRSDIIWAKPNPMPESVTDRPTRSHEYIFLLSKSERYFYDQDAIREPNLESSIQRMMKPWNGETVRGHPSGRAQMISGGRAGGNAPMANVDPNGRNKRSVWTVNSEPTPEAHFATFPQKLIEPCILAGSRTGDLVLDPFIGSGTVGKVAERFGRRWVGLELSENYIGIAKNRTAQRGMQFGTTPTLGTK